MAAPLTLVVAGAPALAEALERSGQVSRVFSVESTGKMRDLIKEGLLSGNKAELAFLFADTLHVDTPNTTLEMLVQRLIAGEYRVGIVALSPGADDLVARHTGAGILRGPFTLNLVLGALAGMGVQGISPIPGGETELNLMGAGFMAPPATPAPVADAGWAQPPATPAPAENWNQPPAQPAAQPAWNQPPAQPQAQPAAAWGQAPAAQPQAPAGPGQWGQAAEPAPSQWGQPPAQPAAQPSWSEAASPVQPGTAPGGFGQAGPAPRAGGAARPAVKPRGYVVTIASPKGGTGKSTMTLNLATYMGMRLRGTGKTVCIIDTNFQQADTGKYLNQYSPNIIDIVKNPGSLTPERLNQFLAHKPELNLSALLGPSKTLDANPMFINAVLYKQVLEVLVQMFDYVFIDTPVAEFFHETFSDFALPSANFIVVPVAPSLTTLQNVDNWLRSITAPRHTGGSGVDPNKVGIVLNRAQAGIDCDPQTVRENLANWTFVGMIPETAEWKKAENNFELIATKNMPDINEAFTRILFSATGEPVLRTTAATTSDNSAKKAPGGFLKKLMGGKG